MAYHKLFVKLLFNAPMVRRIIQCRTLCFVHSAISWIQPHELYQLCIPCKLLSEFLLLIWQPFQDVGKGFFPGLICYLPYILLRQCRGIGSGYLYTLRGFGVSVVGFQGEYAADRVSFRGSIDKTGLAFCFPFFRRLAVW